MNGCDFRKRKTRDFRLTGAERSLPRGAGAKEIQGNLPAGVIEERIMLIENAYPTALFRIFPRFFQASR